MTGIEPAASGFGDRRSGHLSYTPSAPPASHHITPLTTDFPSSEPLPKGQDAAVLPEVVTVETPPGPGILHAGMSRGPCEATADTTRQGVVPPQGRIGSQTRAHPPSSHHPHLRRRRIHHRNHPSAPSNSTTTPPKPLRCPENQAFPGAAGRLPSAIAARPTPGSVPGPTVPHRI